MATVTTTTRPFNYEETRRRVQHPLRLIRKYIRRYIILEGIALTLLCAAALFWLGVGFDFGLFQLEMDLVGLHGVDWIQELNDVDTSGLGSLGIRIMLLGAIAVGLIYLGFTRVVLRWIREFNDGAVALVLERRFPKELGDRLITAVELADPNLAKKYGFSQAMVEKTILEAVETLKTLPVASVFNWRRLGVLWFLLGLSTIGMSLLTMGVFCAGSAIHATMLERAQDDLEDDVPRVEYVAMNPLDFSYQFSDVAAIWSERNVLLMNTYWPRRAHLEVVRFQPSKEDPQRMRVARDDSRPELQIRAIEWVIADRDAPTGWRALTWKDLARDKLIDQALLDGVAIPVDFAEWRMDPDELEPNLAEALLGNELQARRYADMRAKLEEETAKAKIKERGAADELTDWMNWKTWTLDKLAQQMEDTQVSAPLRALRQGQDYRNLEAVFKAVEDLTLEPSMSRTLRHLAVPDEVQVKFRGEGNDSDEKKTRETGNKFTIPLDALNRDSTNYRFRARAENFYTPPRWITLVQAPSPKTISIDKLEPAYIYHRLRGVDQSELRSLKHETKDFSLSSTGELNMIEVPIGSDLVIHVKVDRPLHKEKSAYIRDQALPDAGFDHYHGKSSPIRNAQGDGFSLQMKNLERKYDFSIEFFDEDNIRGRRRFKVLSVLDMPPQLGNLAVYGVNLRKPKFRAQAPQDKDKDPRDMREQAELTGAYLITPDANLPLECSVKDDYGLVRAGFQYKVRKVDFELIIAGGAKKLPTPTLEIDQTMRRYRHGLIMYNFHLGPANPLTYHLAPHIGISGEQLEKDVRRTQEYEEGYIPSEGFRDLLNRPTEQTAHLETIKRRLTDKDHKARTQAWDWDFSKDPGFNVRLYLPRLKGIDVDKGGQSHYLVQIGVQASDNNVETGESYRDENGLELRGRTSRNKGADLKFLVISENELLAQIALEEESIFEYLEAVKEKVDAGIVSLNQQAEKLRGNSPDMDVVMHRMNEIRTALSTSGSKLHDAERAYFNIMREMEVNNVRSDRRKRIEDNIYWRIKRIVEADPIEPTSGSFPRAEDSFSKAIGLVESDFSNKRVPPSSEHGANMADAEKLMVKLSLDINVVLTAMSEGIVEARLIQLLASIEAQQRKTTSRLRQWELEEIERRLKELLADPKKDKKDEKKDAKPTSDARPAGASSQLGSQPRLQLERADLVGRTPVARWQPRFLDRIRREDS